ncbi:MAG: acyl-CoA dehydrogenase family protein, partial [Pseudomonadales bacterium]
MRLRLSTEDERFRDEVRTWLSENVPREPRPGDGEQMRDFDLEWQRRQYEGGWAGINWPKEFDGLGLGLVQQMIWYEEYARCQAPHTGTCFVGLNFGGPTLMRCGSRDLCERHLGPILRGEVIWCQGFSEPNAGSDLASLRTSGEVRGSDIFVNGQKIWTSYAHLADFQILLIRTEAGSKRHRGLTMVVCDMKSSGVEARPIQTMAGDRHFCEVFYDDVLIRPENVIGVVGEGWRVALTTLSFERGSAFMADQVALARKVTDLIALARERSGPEGSRRAIEDDEISRELALLKAETAALRSMTY